jgi:hypothetical protein
VCSLGAGGDMLFAAEALSRNLPVHIFLPYERQQFLAVSVNYFKKEAPGHSIDWEKEFNSIISKAASVTALEGKMKDMELAFTRCNEAMMIFALESVQGNFERVSALALMKEDAPALSGGTVHFVSQLRERNIPVRVVWPGQHETGISSLHLKSIIPAFNYLEHTAMTSQQRWRRRVLFSLSILATIAFFDTFVTAPDEFFDGNGKWVRIFSLMISVTGAFVTLHLQLSDKESHSRWTQARAKAEQIRSEIWYYLFDYWTENNRSGTYTEEEFESYIGMLSRGTNFSPAVKHDELKKLKGNIQSFSLWERKKLYLDLRVYDQLYYFRKKATFYKNRLSHYKILTLIFLVISVTYGILKMLAEFTPMPSLFMGYSPLGLMISLIALVATYVEANDFRELEFRYQMMAEKIEGLANRFEKTTDDREFDELVRESEVTLRAQNNEWSIKRE